MAKKTLIILFIVLAASVVLLFYKKPKPVNYLLPAGPDENDVKNNTPQILTATTVPATVLPPGNFPLGMGSKGKAVQLMQIIVGVTPDGVWGANTNNAVLSKLNDSEITVTDFLKYGMAGGNAGEFPLKFGSKGNYVKAVQVLVNQKPDGILGTNTLAAMQKATGATSLSISGFETLLKKVIFGS